MRIGRRELVSALAALTVGGAGCGGEDAESLVPPFGDDKEGAPNGVLTPEGIGEIELGASADEVSEAFGDPDGATEVDSSEEIGPRDVWSYGPPVGGVSLTFDLDSDELVDYTVFTPDLETAEGVRVGDSKADVREAYGEDLARSEHIDESLVLSGVDPGTDESPVLRFTFSGKRVHLIAGGALTLAPDGSGP